MTRPPPPLRPYLEATLDSAARTFAPPRTAVILAAGSGSRFRAHGVGTPKQLLPLGGLPLLERTIRTARRAGIERFVVVLGCRGDEVRDALAPRLADVDVRWVLHAGWPQGNGSSLLAARPHVTDPTFLVLMGDHLLPPGLLEGLRRAPSDGRACVMAVDRKRGLLVDPDDATKAALDGERVVAVGKRLGAWDAIDTGASLCTPAVFEALEQAARTDGGACSHADGMRRLASRGLLRAHDVGAARWEDVDAPDARAAAESLLYDSLRKPTDGPMSRLLERRLSLAVTRRLAATDVTPNQMTAVSVGVGVAAAASFAQPGFGWQVAAALLFWCSSWIDGCDGELARLKFRETRLGGMLDFAGDNLVHLLVFSAMGFGLWRGSGDLRWLVLGLTASAGVALAAGWVFATRVRPAGRFTTCADGGDAPPLVARLRRATDALGRRDFVFGVLFLALLGWLPGFLWAAAVGTWTYLAVLVALHFAHRPARA
jgi:CDP-L-myo-inositol myo-inositolphosphotransferase